MRLLYLTWAVLAQLAQSSLDNTLICASDTAQDKVGKTPSLSPEIARLVLGHRLGLSQYQTLGDVEEQVLDILNGLPGKRPNLFSDEQQKPFPRVLTVVEDVKDSEGMLSSPSVQKAIYLYM